VSVVDIGTIKGDDVVNFSLKTFSNSLDAENFKTLADIVRACSDSVNITLRQDLHECSSISFKNPILLRSEFTFLVDENFLLFFFLRQVHVDTRNRLDSLKRHIGKDVSFNVSKECVILHLVRSVILILGVLLLIVHDSDSQHKLQITIGE
jgi:hypothetical protein